MELISNERRNSVFDEMKMRVYNQKLQEEREAKLTLEGKRQEERLENIEDEYITNLFKVDDIAELTSRDVALQRKFIEMKIALENADLNEKEKVEAIITSASILNRIDTHVETLPTQEFTLLALLLAPIAIEDYDMYGTLLSHPRVLASILEKTDNIQEQKGICYKLMRECQKHPYAQLDNELYQKNVDNLINTINSYSTNTKKKIR